MPLSKLAESTQSSVKARAWLQPLLATAPTRPPAAGVLEETENRSEELPAVPFIGALFSDPRKAFPVRLLQIAQDRIIIIRREKAP
jgi:hypothetical protein